VIKPYNIIKSAWADSAFEVRSIEVFHWLHQAGVNSPIEKVMGEALGNIHSIAMEGFGSMDWLTQLSSPTEFENPYDQGLFQISPQVAVGSYSVDFAMRCFACPKVKVAIECDGHDFHEKTKAQAAHDKRRDRDIQRAGFDILRFTGSEIWNNPVNCAVEVFQHFASRVDGDDGWAVIHDKADKLWVGR
jgi:very-short-patch-repair endonuclease